MAGISVPGTCRACPSSTHRSEHLSTIYTSLLSLPKLPLQIPHTHTIPHGHSTIPGPRNHFPVFGIHFARHILGTRHTNHSGNHLTTNVSPSYPCMTCSGRQQLGTRILCGVRLPISFL